MTSQCRIISLLNNHFHLRQRFGVVPDLDQMRSDLIDWVEFKGVANAEPPKTEKPLIDLGDAAENQVPLSYGTFRRC